MVYAVTIRELLILVVTTTGIVPVNVAYTQTAPKKAASARPRRRLNSRVNGRQEIIHGGKKRLAEFTANWTAWLPADKARAGGHVGPKPAWARGGRVGSAPERIGGAAPRERAPGVALSHVVHRLKRRATIASTFQTDL